MDDKHRSFVTVDVPKDLAAFKARLSKLESFYKGVEPELQKAEQQVEARLKILRKYLQELDETISAGENVAKFADARSFTMIDITEEHQKDAENSEQYEENARQRVSGAKIEVEAIRSGLRSTRHALDNVIHELSISSSLLKEAGEYNNEIAALQLRAADVAGHIGLVKRDLEHLIKIYGFVDVALTEYNTRTAAKPVAVRTDSIGDIV